MNIFTRGNLLFGLTFCLLMGLAAVSFTRTTKPDGRPNLLLIVSEDNSPDLGCYGNADVFTPNLDRLAAEGVRFERAFVPQAGCSQSRAAYLTGLYPHQNGQIGLATWGFELYDGATPNIIRSLKAAGYRTGIVGKLHINPEESFPFDFAEIPKGNFERKDLARYAEEAARFLQESDQPFFLSVNYPEAHRPFLAQVDNIPADPLQPGDVQTPPNIGLETETLRENTANYYNCMSRLDVLVGDLLRKLEESGKAENTLIVYLGDHGADLIRGKRTCYEGGLRVPLIVYWPGRIKAGQVRQELVSTIDLVPTWLEVSGAEPVSGLPGASLVPLLEGKSGSWRELLFTEYHLHSLDNYYPQRAVRDDRYKLIRNLMPGEINPGYDFTIERFYNQAEFDSLLTKAPEDIRRTYEILRQPPEFELYDLKDDPYEFRNLAESPDHRQVLDRLVKELESWRSGTNDPLLNPENVQRLKAEIEAQFIDGSYRKPKSPWKYTSYFFENR